MFTLAHGASARLLRLTSACFALECACEFAGALCTPNARPCAQHLEPLAHAVLLERKPRQVCNAVVASEVRSKK